jgi:hypothetical protein
MPTIPASIRSAIVIAARRSPEYRYAARPISSKFLELTDASSADLAELAPPLRDLVRDCLDLNPRVRPTATEALGRFAPTQVASTTADLVGRIPGRRSPG